MSHTPDRNRQRARNEGEENGQTHQGRRYGTGPSTHSAEYNSSGHPSLKISMKDEWSVRVLARLTVFAGNWSGLHGHSDRTRDMKFQSSPAIAIDRRGQGARLRCFHRAAVTVAATHRWFAFAEGNQRGFIMAWFVRNAPTQGGGKGKVRRHMRNREDQMSLTINLWCIEVGRWNTRIYCLCWTHLSLSSYLSASSLGPTSRTVCHEDKMYQPQRPNGSFYEADGTRLAGLPPLLPDRACDPKLNDRVFLCSGPTAELHHAKGV
jgi:hypothetical protein